MQTIQCNVKHLNRLTYNETYKIINEKNGKYLIKNNELSEEYFDKSFFKNNMHAHAKFNKEKCMYCDKLATCKEPAYDEMVCDDCLESIVNEEQNIKDLLIEVTY